MNGAIDQFRVAMLDHLGHAPQHIEPGTFHRFPTSPRQTDRAGYCKLWPDALGGFFGDFRTGCSRTWSAVDCQSMGASQRAQFERQIAQAKAERDQAQAVQWGRNRKRIRSLWNGAHKLTPGDPVTLYLRRRVLAGLWPPPSCLRYAPALPYWHDGQMLGEHPAMLAAFRGAKGEVVGVHQTYLTRDGRKASVPTVKKMSPAAGLLMGGCIPLADPVDQLLGVAEGIETALCAGIASGIPVVAAYSAGCLAGYQWPKLVKRLVIFADHDENGTGQVAARKLEGRARAAGVLVSVLIPQTRGDDWADVYARRGDLRECVK